MKKQISIFLLVLGSSYYAQVKELPVHFGQFYNNAQLNPAKGASKAKVEIQNGNRRNQGGFGGIKTSFASTFFRLKENEGSFHSIGVLFNNDREGSFIRRNRVYLAYARHQELNSVWKLAAGFSGGFYNFSTKSNPVIGGASSGTLDLNLGLNLYSANTSLGFSINQLNGASVQPFVQEIKLVPQYNLIAEHQLELNEVITVSPSAFFRYANLQNQELNNRIGGSLNFLVAKRLNIGGSYETKEGVYFFAGVHNIKINEASTSSKNVFDIDFSYFIPNLNNSRTNINAYELTLKYFILKK